MAMNTNNTAFSRKELGTRIAQLRLLRGETQETLGEALGVSREIIQHWEAGTRQIKADAIVKLATRFNVSADYLLNLTKAETINAGISASPTKALEFTEKILCAIDCLEFVRRAVGDNPNCEAQNGLVEVVMDTLGFGDYYSINESDKRWESLDTAWNAVIDVQGDVTVRAKLLIELSMSLNSEMPKEE